MATRLALARARLPLDASDLRGLSRLAVDGVVGVTDIVEVMHFTIGSRIGLRRAASGARTSGITGLVYGAVRGATRVVGQGLEAVLPPHRPGPASDRPERQAFVAALNGVWGDHLERTGNPLAIDMSLRAGGRPYRESIEAPSGRIVVMVHGLAMNDLQWCHRGHDHGQMLAHDLGFSAVYLHYNSGRHISQNGREFSAQLESLVTTWPVPVQELVIIGHSMGGLVARSACAVGAGQRWMTMLTKLVCLGTPHHGAPLERGGRLVDALLEFSPYAAPLARLGKARSAGITDLRYGNLQDADWQHRDRHAQRRDDRVPTPLPAGVETYLVAATKSKAADGVHGRLLGDGLVPLASALGEHADPARSLGVPKQRQLVIASAGHWDLLSDARVGASLCRWLR